MSIPQHLHGLFPDGLFHLHYSPPLASRLTLRYLGVDDVARLGRLYRDSWRSLEAVKSLPPLSADDPAAPYRADLIRKLRAKVKAIQRTLADLDEAGVIP